MFENNSIRHLVSSCSDHSPLLVGYDILVDQHVRPRLRQYEVMWERELAIQDVIHKAWVQAGSKQSLGDVHHALRGTMLKLCQCSKEKFGSVTRET